MSKQYTFVFNRTVREAAVKVITAESLEEARKEAQKVNELSEDLEWRGAHVIDQSFGVSAVTTKRVKE